jgi:hypothetical protein
MLHCEIGMKSYFTFHRPASAQRYHSERMWHEGDFCSLFTGHATERPYAVARQDVCEALTWGEFKRWTRTAAADLCEYGRIRYDRVMMWSEPHREAPPGLDSPGRPQHPSLAQVSILLNRGHVDSQRVWHRLCWLTKRNNSGRVV